MLKKNIFLFPILLIIIATASIANGISEPVFTSEEIAQLSFSDAEWKKEKKAYSQAKNGQQWTGVVDIIRTPKDRKELTQFSSNTMGPQISVISPAFLGDRYFSTIPVTLLVYLKGQQSPVNIDSLIVKGKRGPFTTNITKRIKKHLRQPKADENADYVLDAKLPKLKQGKYQIMVSLSDIEGNIKDLSVFLEVKK